MRNTSPTPIRAPARPVTKSWRGRRRGAVWGSALWLLALAACSDDSSEEPVVASCEPGEVQVCTDSSGNAGEQECSEAGTLGACVQPADAGVSSSAEPVLMSELPDEPERPTNLPIGSACESDEECGAGKWCILSGGGTFGGGGVPGGYCTADCETQEDCDAVDDNAACAGVQNQGGGRLCLRSCLSQDPDPGENKCLNRPNIACRSVAAVGLEVFNGSRQDGFCFPTCRSDADCAPRFCHAGAGLCTDFPATGAPVGGACNEDADCAGGLCDFPGTVRSSCTQLCKAGSNYGCGYAEDDVPAAACLAPFVQASRFTEGLGDLGKCREVCDEDADCVQEGWRCIPSALAEERAGRSGGCVPPEILDDDPQEEPDPDPVDQPDAG